MIDKTGKLKVGHGSDPNTTMGPMTTVRGIAKAEAHIEDAKKHGAKVIMGGRKIDGMGYFFEPTIVTDANENMLLSNEEQFAPIAAFFPFDTEEEAVEAANKTSMGLASYFFTKNVDRTWRLLENLEAGMIGMNTGMQQTVQLANTPTLTELIGNSSAAESPFGGIKESGYGKESGLGVAVEEYLITKTGTLTLDGHY